MASAVRNAPRQWWQHATRMHGNLYSCIWFHRSVDGLPVEWEVLRQKFAREMMGSIYMNRARRDGFAVRNIWLAHPQDVFSAAAKVFGLNCRRCGARAAEAWFAADHLCPACMKAARKAGGVEHLLARDIIKGARNIMKEARNGRLA